MPDILIFVFAHQARVLCEARQFGMAMGGEIVTTLPLIAVTTLRCSWTRFTSPAPLPPSSEQMLSVSQTQIVPVSVSLSLS